MAHVRRLDTGRWQARYRGPDGRERAKTFGRKVDAERFLNQVEVDKARGAWADPRLGRRRFGEWVEEWHRTAVGLAPASQVRDESVLRNHLLPRFADMPLASIRQLEVRAWIADLDASGLAPNTVHKAYQILTKVLAVAVDAGILAVSPCRNIALPRVEVAETRFLSPIEVAILADVMEPRYRALVLLGAYGGLRIGEMAGLRRNRLDLLRSRVDVAEKVVEVRGELISGGPKTKAGLRQVPLPRPVTEELAEHLARFGEAGPDGLVFPGRDGGALRARAWRARHWLPAVSGAGLTPLRAHDLRHTAVALWIAQGASPKQIAVWAGHTSVSVVLDRYGHLFPGHETEVLGRLEAAYVAPSGRAADVLRMGSQSADSEVPADFSRTRTRRRGSAA